MYHALGRPSKSRSHSLASVVGMEAPQTSAILRVERLTVRYGDQLALAQVDLCVERGTTVAVIGPNGSGKSTLLAAVAGLVTPSSGNVKVDRDQVALVLQSTEIDRTLPITVYETVRMARYPHLGLFRRFRPADKAAVETAMARTAVDGMARRQLHSLSGGERQRVLVAQGLAQEADLLLLDEPVTGLDIASRDLILNVIQQEKASGRSVVMTTHSLEEAAQCDLVVLLNTRIVAAGTPEEVIVDEHLNAAFGTRVVRLASGALILDDPHHHAVS
jgi:ABC-type Mn2+/Zn2+ transport system ATPase subunit